jgi:hypothetical protein
MSTTEYLKIRDAICGLVEECEKLDNKTDLETILNLLLHDENMAMSQGDLLVHLNALEEQGRLNSDLISIHPGKEKQYFQCYRRVYRLR